MRSSALFCFVLLAFSSVLHVPVFAAPQILAALSTDTPIPVTCKNGVCEAELSTFCLQRYRPAPEQGAVYVPANPEAFALVVTTAAGKTRRLAAAQNLQFVQRRSYTAALVRFPEAAVSEVAGETISIEVGANATLVPEPRTGDPNPLTATEIEEAITNLRSLGARLVDDQGSRAGAARIVVKIVNALPKESQASGAQREAAWQSVLAGRAATQSAREAWKLAKAAYDRCVSALLDYSALDLRSCLETRHDEFMRHLNDIYWKAAVGS